MSKVYNYSAVRDKDVLRASQAAGGEASLVETQTKALEQTPEDVPQSYDVCDYLTGDPTAPQFRALRDLFRQHMQASSDTPSLLPDILSMYGEEIKILLAQIEAEAKP